MPKHYELHKVELPKGPSTPKAPNVSNEYFDNHGIAVSESEISSRINHPGGKWGPEYDHTKPGVPPTKRSKE